MLRPIPGFLVSGSCFEPEAMEQELGARLSAIPAGTIRTFEICVHLRLSAH